MSPIAFGALAPPVAAVVGGGLFMLALIIIGGLISLAGFLFWLWMLIEAATKEPSEGSDKVVWVIVILVLPVIGSLIYFFIRRPQRITEHGH